MSRPLLVTNDFPPDIGGIQQFVAQIAARLDGVGVFAPAHPEADDRALGYPVWRGPRRFLWPTGQTLRAVRGAIAAHRATVVVFMAPSPLTPLGPFLDLPWAAVAHGAELVLPARLPGSRQVFAAVLGRADRLFAVSDYTADVVRGVVGPGGPAVHLLRNGVDLTHFRPDIDPSDIRCRFGLADDPVIVTVGRLVPRKGQDRLIRVLPRVRAAVPGTRLLIVGDGRDRRRLEGLAARHLGTPHGGHDPAAILAGSMAWAHLPAVYRAGTVFAHPNRSRWGGLEQEGFGVVFLEAQACGVPVVAGRSGGSPEALEDGVTGLLVDGRDDEQIADALIAVLSDPARAAAMGTAARARVARDWSWDAIVAGFGRDLTQLATRA